MDEEEAKMDEEKTKTDEIIQLAMAEGDKGILDLMDFVWGNTIYDRLSADIETMPEEEKEDLLNEMGGDNAPDIYVDKVKFVCWYFDEETEKSVMNELIEKGEVSLIGILRGVGYIPLDFIINKEDVRKEDINKEDGEIEEPGDKYRLEFK